MYSYSISALISSKILQSDSIRELLFWRTANWRGRRVHKIDKRAKEKNASDLSRV